jgi:SAM-dependent methyltransferase
MADFYTQTLRKLIRRGHMGPDMRVLVVCGGGLDRQVLLECGFRDVIISNLDARMRGDEFAPFRWSFQDAEALSFADNEFDFCIAHSGLHHCYSPHRALLEMYRVSRAGILIFEPRDGLLVRLGVRLNMGQDYEVAAVFDNDLIFGGVRNTEVPNYVYRWTPNEVRKTIKSYAPVGHHGFEFYYAMRVPWQRLKLMRNKLYLAGAIAALPFLKALSLVVPALCNNFGFLVLKPKIPGDLFPWLTTASGKLELNKGWVTARYRKAERQGRAEVPSELGSDGFSGASPNPRNG